MEKGQKEKKSWGEGIMGRIGRLYVGLELEYLN